MVLVIRIPEKCPIMLSETFTCHSEMCKIHRFLYKKLLKHTYLSENPTNVQSCCQRVSKSHLGLFIGLLVILLLNKIHIISEAWISLKCKRTVNGCGSGG